MRRIDPVHLLRSAPAYAVEAARAFRRFRRPASLLGHYFTRTPPPGNALALRSGMRIVLSEHPHDVVTAFVIFVREDYGVVAPGSVVVDIGANIGTFSLYAAWCGASRVYAFEPNSQAYAALVRNIEVNGLGSVITPFNLAVSGAEGETLRLPVGSSPYNTVLAEGDDRVVTAPVTTTTLDTILDANALDRVDLLKVDCEGGEYPMFTAASEGALTRIGELRMEFHPGPLDAMIARLTGAGLETTRFDRHSATLWMKRRDRA